MIDLRADIVDALVADSHEAAQASGWYKDPRTGQPIARNFGEMIALMHSELSECLEAHRKALPAEHLEGFTGIEEELADLLIRAFDLAGYVKARLGAAYVAKRKFNDTREDHRPENRAKPGGKAY